MNLYTDLQGDRLTTRLIQMGWEFTIEQYPSWRFRLIDDPDRQFPNVSVWPLTRTQSDGPEPLLILTIGVIVIGLGTPESVWEHRWQLWEHLDGPATILEAPWITDQLSGTNNIFFWNAAGAPGNHCYYLSFHNFLNSGIQFVFSSMYLYSYPCVHGISGLAEGGTWEDIEVPLKMMIERTQRYTPRLWSSEFGDALWSHNHANLQAIIQEIWRP